MWIYTAQTLHIVRCVLRIFISKTYQQAGNLMCFFYCIDSESLDWSPPPPWPYKEYDRRAANLILRLIIMLARVSIVICQL